MSDVPILLKGWLLGFAIAAPVGLSAGFGLAAFLIR